MPKYRVYLEVVDYETVEVEAEDEFEAEELALGETSLWGADVVEVEELNG